jgi:cell wall-associated NlpC family hydrolase
MDELELDQRVALVKSARLWLGTPFHHFAAVRGAGIDCAHLLLEAHVGAGLGERFAPEHYPHDWMLHRNEERFLATLERYLIRVGDGEESIRDRGADFRVRPGNVVIWRFGRTFSHGAIVSQWPNIIHASFPAGTCLEESAMGGILEEKPMRVYSFWNR